MQYTKTNTKEQQKLENKDSLQMEEQEECPEKERNEMEASSLSETE